ncbi:MULTISPECIES: hypothetical protein [Methylocaldum]|uniref:hypothetical protein n=1 Tax=Methylocaldum sp. GT1TLB TaxID=3438965 RepID=UPI003DA103D6
MQFDRSRHFSIPASFFRKKNGTFEPFALWEKSLLKRRLRLEEEGRSEKASMAESKKENLP